VDEKNEKRNEEKFNTLEELIAIRNCNYNPNLKVFT
jgi:hypothetical protein